MHWLEPLNLTDGRSAVVVFRGRFAVAAGESPRRLVEFSADERCQLFLDGAFVADGPERGAPSRWYFQRAELELSPGKHVLCARVLCFNQQERAYGQTTVRHGLALRGLEDAVWDAQVEPLDFEEPFPDWGSYPRVRVSEDYPAGILRGEGDGWEAVATFEDDRALFPPDLPQMTREAVVPEELRPGLYRFREYVLAWPVYHFRGTGHVRIRWSETPYVRPEFDRTYLKGDKGRRNGHFFVGNYDEFEVRGALDFPGIWLRAGRYVEIECTEGTVKTTAEYFRTGYPLPAPRANDRLVKMAFESLRNCCWETFFDCPYYEQLMYIGDSRLEALAIYTLTDDHRLPEKALRLLALGQQTDGRLLSQYPSKGIQVIPSFMPVFLLMLNDYCCLHGRNALVAELLPVAARLVTWFRTTLRDDGMTAPDGWRFLDWCAGWEEGVPPGEDRLNSSLNLMWALGLQASAQCSGDPAVLPLVDRMLMRIREVFFDDARQLLADDVAHKHFSEHAQALAILAELPGWKQLVCGMEHAQHLTECSLYFSFYYLQAMRKIGRKDWLEQRLDRFRALAEKGLVTLPEEFDTPRSDCHGWGAHVLVLLESPRQRIQST
ncbi:MAG: hypothetical protein J6Y80_04290 [Victivallales bacterium]|nr:hypothetical protein [Victivallales bacterium]